MQFKRYLSERTEIMTSWDEINMYKHCMSAKGTPAQNRRERFIIYLYYAIIYIIIIVFIVRIVSILKNKLCHQN